jgi:hypothetical protein
MSECRPLTPLKLSVNADIPFRSPVPTRDIGVDHSITWSEMADRLSPSALEGGARAWCRTAARDAHFHFLLTLGLGAGIHLAMDYSHLPRRIFARARRLLAGVWDMRMH